MATEFRFRPRCSRRPVRSGSAGTGRGVSRRGGLIDKLSLPAGIDSNPCADTVAVTLCAAEGKLKPMVVIRTVVHPDFRRRAEGRDHNVEFPVMIEIANRSAAMAARGQCVETGLRCQCRPATCRPIPEDCVGLIDLDDRGHRR